VFLICRVFVPTGRIVTARFAATARDVTAALPGPV
jgi:hypothetical protein